MLFIPQTPHLLGFELDGALVRQALISVLCNKISIQRLQKGNVLLDVKPLDKEAVVVSGIDTPHVLVRPLEINLTKEADIQSVLDFQIEPLIPYEIQEAITAATPIEKREESTLLTVVAVRKSIVAEHLQKLETLNMDVEVVSATPLALASFTRLLAPSNELQCLVHISQTTTTCILIQNHHLVASHSIPLGAQNVSQDPSTLALLRQELTKTLFALSQHLKDKKLSEVIATGTPIPSLSPLPFKLVAPTPLDDKTSTADLQEFAVALGLAINGSNESLNLRKQEFAYPRPWKRLKRKALTCLFLSLLLAVTAFGGGKVFIHHQEQKLQTQYLTLLTTSEYTLESFEKEYRKQLNLSPLKTPLLLGSLTEQEIVSRSALLEKTFKQPSTIFPLFPDVPRVGDVLAWISNNPLFANKEEHALIDTFTYTLVKRPQADRPKDPYQVRVEIQLFTPSTRLARAFREALLEPNPYIDTSSEILWQAGKGGEYTTSFLLKDNTRYVSPR